MSGRIEQVLEVLEEVKKEYLENRLQHRISSLRQKAVRKVSKRRSISPNAVADKYIRQLAPRITKTDDFDRFLSEWLIKGDNAIQDILLARTVTNKDKERINHFFDTLPVLGSIPTVQNEQIENDSGKDTIIYPDENLSTGKYLEGNSKRIYVNIYERNPKAKKDCIAVYGTDCSVCEFNFQDNYGEIGENFIHVHHLEMLSSLGDNYEVDPVKDLRPVCPNCHAMIHKRNPPFTIEELKQIFNRLSNQAQQR
jgi:predicted HNH restriction endonuclease